MLQLDINEEGKVCCPFTLTLTFGCERELKIGPAIPRGCHISLHMTKLIERAVYHFVSRDIEPYFARAWQSR